MAEEEANELSWLKSDSTKSTNVEKPVPVARSRGEEKDDTPSWLFEDNDAKLAAAQEPTGDGGKPPKTTLSKLAGGIKWKQPMNRGKDLDEGSGDDDEASCCGCCPGDPMLFSFQCFHFTAGMIGIAAFAANIYVFTQPYLTPKDAIMRSYALLFCLLVVIIEMDWRYVVNKIRFADLWVPRGLFYTLVGFVTCKSAISSSSFIFSEIHILHVY